MGEPDVNRAAPGAAVPESQSLSYELDSEGFKVVADRLVEEAGVRPMLHRQFVAPVMEGDRIAGIIVESKAGREAILARVVIDATGVAAALAVKTGCDLDAIDLAAAQAELRRQGVRIH